jgi:hypothetical protein
MRSGAPGLVADAFSGHSLRSGFLTSAATRGASLFKMMDVSRHKSVDVLRGYVRDAEAFPGSCGSRFAVIDWMSAFGAESAATAMRAIIA